MSYRIRQSSESSEDSDSKDDIFWKRKRKSADTHISQGMDVEMGNCAPPKRSRNIIWRNVLHEHDLGEALSGSHMLEGLDKTRGVESYYFREQPDEANTELPEDSSIHPPRCNDLRLQISEGRQRVMAIIINNEYDPTLPRSHIRATFDSPSDIAKSVITEYLEEPNMEVIERVVDVLGVKLSMEFLYLTEDVQNAGGLYFANGAKRRSPGGVYFHIIKNSTQLADDLKRSVFIQNKEENVAKKRKQKKHKKRTRKQKNIPCDEPPPADIPLFDNNLPSPTIDSTCLPLNTVDFPEDGEVLSLEEDSE